MRPPCPKAQGRTKSKGASPGSSSCIVRSTGFVLPSIETVNNKSVLMVVGELSYETYQQIFSGVYDPGTIAHTLLQDLVVKRLIEIAINHLF